MNSRQKKPTLYRILDSYLGELRMEMHHTDAYAFREQLKRREDFLHKVLKLLATELDIVHM